MTDQDHDFLHGIRAHCDQGALTCSWVDRPTNYDFTSSASRGGSVGTRTGFEMPNTLVFLPMSKVPCLGPYTRT